VHHVRAIREAEGWIYDEEADRWEPGDEAEWIDLRWADPEDPQQILQLREDHDLDVMKAVKHRLGGYAAVRALMAPQEATGRPGLYIMDSCPHTIREHEQLQYPPERAGRDGAEYPRRMDDHTVDCVRYGCVGILRAV
jgi:hypothetical protein